MLKRKLLFALYSTLFVVLPTGCHSQQASQGANSAQAQQSDFKMVDNPGGGQFAYGTLTGQTSLSSGMVSMLRQVHARFGEKPQIGKLFQARDGSSLATFFTLSAKSIGGKQVTGLVIVSMHKGQTPQGAAIYDFADHFVQSEPSLLQALSSAWSGMGSGGSGGASASGQTQSIAPIHEVTGGDNSAYISMPEDWHLESVSGGSLVAVGPHGERVGLGLLYQGIAPSAARSAWGPPAKLICPLTSDLFNAYVSVMNQVRRNNHAPPASFQLISQKQLPSDGGPVPPVQAIFTVDLNDGIGPRKASARIGAMHVANLPTWAMTVSTSNIPLKYVDAETPLLRAMLATYHQNGQVISAETRTQLEQIRQIGVRTQINVDAANDRREASAASYEQHMSDLDWSSKVTQNYILDRTVIRDTETDGHATVGNRFADLLIQSNPNRFEAVPNQQMIPGTDY